MAREIQLPVGYVGVGRFLWGVGVEGGGGWSGGRTMRV